MDADMVVTGDIKELFDLADSTNAVSVMMDQQRFEWASMMVFSNGCCGILTPEYVDNEENKLFDLEWAPYVGALPPEWNHCVGYQEPQEAKLYHYTQGLPCFPETIGLPEDEAWFKEREVLTDTVSWKDLMGRSVHAKPVLTRFLKRYQ